jgi:NADH:ubiquinone oxidoreductase subunit E
MEAVYKEFLEKNQEKISELEKFIDAIEEKEGSLISVLHEAQHIFGYLPREVQLFVAQKLNITAAKVYGVVSFYSFFTMEPKGEHVIDVCLGTACYVRGADKVLAEIEEQLGIKAGQTSKDGKFTLSCLRCVGACGLAPVIIIDGDVYGKVTADEVSGILDKVADK